MENNYSAKDIQVLEGLEAVRKRPGMYIGNTGSSGLHHLIWEIVDNSIDEALAGYCENIEITINKDNSITVKDDGRGIPTGIHPKTGISTVETVFTILHAGGKFGGGGYKVSGGLHGVGASVVNALSSSLEAKIYQEGKVYQIIFQNGGEVVKNLQEIGTCPVEQTGTTVTFQADPLVFTETTEYDYEILRSRVKELAYLNKNLKMILIDDRQVELKKEEFLYEGGIKEFVKELNKNKDTIHDDIIYLSGKENDISLEVSFQYNTDYASRLYSFTNNIKTYEGGTHEDGVKRALTRVINNYARKNNLLKEKDESLIGDDVKEGLVMIISCKHPNPQFEGQTKTKLGNSEVRKISDKIFSEGFEKFLLENPTEAKKIFDKATTASRARLAAKRARDMIRKTNVLEFSGLPGKLSDCSSKDASESEIFIVEGDSAGGSAKDGRNSKTQAILPLKGKPLNVEKTRFDKALENTEIKSMITAFGTGIGEDFDISKLRYHKIVLMTDADVDGSHIRILLLTFLYRYLKPVIEQGYVYSAQPPLYAIEKNKKIKYVYTDEEKDEYLETLDDKTRIKISRFKGLGEMDAEELWQTTMNIETRTLLKITLEDAIMADQVLSDLMGEEVEPRRKYIEENAKFVNNLDI